MKATLRFVFCGIGLLFSANALAAVSTNDALNLFLNNDGLELMAKELRTNYLKPVNNARLPDYEEKVDGGVTVKTQGMYFSTNFGDLRFVARNGHLDVALDINKVRLDVKKAKFTKKVIINISSTCEDTSIEVNGGTLTGQLKLNVASGDLEVTAPHLNFPISQQGYKVEGPRKCSGFLIGGLIKNFVHSTLKKSRATIEKQLNKKLKEVVPKFGDELNKLVKRDIPVDLGMYFSLRQQVTLNTYPHAVKITNQGLDFTLGVSVSRVKRVVATGFEFNTARAMKVGKLGMNPKVINNILKKLLTQVPEWTHLSDNLFPGIEDILLVENLSSIWPDLETLTLSSNSVKAHAGFVSAPSFELVKRAAVLRATFPLKFKFEIQRQGKWEPYFEMTLKVGLSTKLDVKNNELSVALESDFEVVVGGSWDASYEPTDPAFEAELAEVLFTGLFEYLYASGQVLKFGLPSFDMAGKKLYIDSPYVSKPYLAVSLLAS